MKAQNLKLRRIKIEDFPFVFTWSTETDVTNIRSRKMLEKLGFKEINSIVEESSLNKEVQYNFSI